MIRILKSTSEQNQMASKHFDLLEAKFQLASKLATVICDKKLPAYERIFFNKLNNNLKKIIVSTPKELTKLHNEIVPLYEAYISKKSYGLKGNHKKTAIKKANNKVLNIFDYNTFISKSDGEYAYKFTENLDLNVCVYCNRQYTFTLRESDGKCRPTIDHFFKKATHPYFALSFFNLIPSCYTCNSSLKNQANFTLDKFLHPFSESMFEVLDFSIDITSVDFVNGVKEDYKISLKPSKKCSDTLLIAKAESNAKVFKIRELYSGHKDYATEIIKKCYYYDKEKINELLNFETLSGNRLFSSRIEVVEFAFGNFITEDKLGKRPLSKFTRDLAYDLGIENVL